jgi:hypothetical protein
MLLGCARKPAFYLVFIGRLLGAPESPVIVSQLRQILQTLVCRHGVLQTVFSENGYGESAYY